MRIVNDNLNRYTRTEKPSQALPNGKPVPAFALASRLELKHFNNMWKSALAQDLADVISTYNLKNTLITPDMLKRLSGLVEQYYKHFDVWNTHAHIIQTPFTNSALFKMCGQEKTFGHSVIVMQSDIAREEILICKRGDDIFSVFTRTLRQMTYLLKERYTLLPLCNYLNQNIVNRNSTNGGLGLFISRLWSESVKKQIRPYWFPHGINVKLSTKEPFKQFGTFTRAELKPILRHLREIKKS